MELVQITDLAKQGGKLSSDRQWELADALASITDTEVSIVATQSGRNESTLHQYARAAQRWPELDRVEGVSFSAHRVALSWHDPRGLLVDLKHKLGSPTVKQVRQAMGLEGHPALELGEKMLKAIDRKVSVYALRAIEAELLKAILNLEGDVTQVVEEAPPTVEEPVEQPVEQPTTHKWTPPVRVNDITGI